MFPKSSLKQRFSPTLILSRDKALGTYPVWWNSITGNRTVKELSVYSLANSSTNVTFLNQSNTTNPPNAQYTLTVLGATGSTGCYMSGSQTVLTVRGLHLYCPTGLSNDSGSTLTLDGAHLFGTRLTVDDTWGIHANGKFNVLSGARVVSPKFRLGSNSTDGGTATVSGANSLMTISQDTWVGEFGYGSLKVLDGGQVANGDAYVGYYSTASGSAEVSGYGSSWSSTGGLTIAGYGSGQLRIDRGGLVSDDYGDIAAQSGSFGTVTVNGWDSLWLNAVGLVVGGSGTGILNIENSGRVTSGDGFIGYYSSGTGTVNVSGDYSRWTIGDDLTVGENGRGTLIIGNDGVVTVADTLEIGANGFVSLDGGWLDFGTGKLSDFRRVSASAGTITGTLNHTGSMDLGAVYSLLNPDVNTDGVTVQNSGILYGNASANFKLINLAGSEIETVGSERMRFGNAGNTNEGQINIFGGQVRYLQDLTNKSGGEINNHGYSFVADRVTNEAGGFIAGRGQFVANNGWDNSGVMAFSSGTTDIIGDVNNLAGGKIVTSGLGTTTFYGDVVHNGSEIRTAANAATVFFGAVSGAGPFTGTGTVFMEGDLRPGNSPAAVTFEGDLVLGSGATTTFELEGTVANQFDQLLIAGDLDLGGSALNVSVGFQLGNNMKFLVADVEGDLTGTSSDCRKAPESAPIPVLICSSLTEESMAMTESGFIPCSACRSRRRWQGFSRLWLQWVCSVVADGRF